MPSSSAHNRAYREKNQGRLKEQRKAYRLKNIDTVRAKLREWRTANLERTKVTQRTWRAALKLEVLSKYATRGGIKCSCCFESHVAFLTIDHKNGKGGEHRRELFGNQNAGKRFYFWLKKNGWPKGYQVLCFNCNVAKSVLDVCPHKQKKVGHEFPKLH